MKCKLYLPCENTDDTSFVIDDNYYGENEYIKALQEEYNRTNADITAFSTSNQPFRYISDTTASQITKTPQREEKTHYTSCECIPFNENNIEETVDSLVMYGVEPDDVVVMILKLNFDTMEEEFESEFKMWDETHKKIQQQKMDSDWKFMNEPKRTVVLGFPNLKNIETFIELSNCKILEQIDKERYVLIIEKINFKKEL